MAIKDIEALASSDDPIVAGLARDILSQSAGLEGAGIDPGPLEPRQSLLMKGLDVIDTPRQWVAGIGDSLVRGDLGQQGLFGAAARGAREDISTSDILRRGGVTNPLARGILGFAGDVLTDPLTWLTLGTSGLAKAGVNGGISLSKQGLAASKAFAASNLAGLTDAAQMGARTLESMQAIDKASDALHALDNGQMAAKRMVAELSKSTGPVTDITQYTRQLLDNATASEEAARVFGADVAQNVDNLIGRGQRVALEANLPFLGYFTKSDAPIMKAIQKEGGPIGEVFDGVIKKGGLGRAVTDVAGAIGSVVKPGKVTLWEKQLSQNELLTLQKVASETKSRMGEFAVKVDGKLRALPGGSAISDVTKKAADLASSAGAEMGKQFKRIFVSSYLGPKFKAIREDQINSKAMAEQVAMTDVISSFGKEISDPSGQGAELMRRSYFLIDAAAKQEIAALKNLSPELADDMLASINARRLGIEGQSWDDLVKKAKQVDPNFNSDALTFNQRVNQQLDVMGAEPELRQMVKRIQDYQDGLILNELKDGVAISPIDAYVTHAYTNKTVLDPVTRRPVATGPVSGGFTKTRKYSTVDEALTDAGLVQDTNVANLLSERARASWIKRGEAQFARRAFLQGGMSQEQLATLANSYLKGDHAAGVLLTGRGFDLPKSRALDDASAKSLLGVLKGPFKEFEPKRLMELGMSEAEAAKTALDLNSGAIEDMAAYVRNIHANMFAVSSRPQDLSVPNSILGEIADKVTIPGTKEELFVPKELGRAIRETLAGRDFLKNAAGKSEISQRLLGVSDQAVNFFKRMVTLPFPAYWAQNAIGDQFFKLMDGGFTAMDPGYLQKAHSALSGRAAIKTPYGVITPDVFTKTLRENGINFGSRDMAGLLDNFEAMDVTKALSKKGGMVKRALDARKQGLNPIDGIVEGVKEAQSGFQFAFGEFTRVSHIIHRLERGDTIQNAIRYGQEAMLNYRTLSPVEQSLFRRFFMFYGFLGQGTKRQLNALITRPGDFAMQVKAARGAAELFSDPNAAPTADEMDLKMLKSAAASEQVSFALGKGKDGKPIIGRGFGLPVNTALSTFDIKLPRAMSVGEVVDSVTDSFTRTFQKAAASATPLPKMTAELISGKNLYFNKPLSAQFLRKLPSFEAASKKLQEYPGGAIPAAAFDALDSVTKDILGGVPDGKGAYIVPTRTMWVLNNFIPGFGRVVSSANAATNANIPTAQAATRLLSGIRIESNDPTASALSDIRENLRATAEDQSLSQRKRNAQNE